MKLFKKLFFLFTIITTAIFISTIYNLHFYDKKNNKLGYIKSEYIKLKILLFGTTIISLSFFSLNFTNLN